MSDDLTHIRRTLLPWRTDDGLTECGQDASTRPTWTRDEAVAQRARLGQSRFAMVSCMTCMQRSRVRYSASGDGGLHSQASGDDLLAVLQREIGRATQHPAERDRLAAELEAAVALISAHRDEFDTYLTDRAGTVSLSEARRKRSRG